MIYIHCGINIIIKAADTDTWSMKR